MNKKFSTLVAALLVAGAWTTLDARVIEVTAPKVGGSYLIGSAVAEGDAADGKVTTLLQPTDGTSAAATAAAVQSYGNEWTFEAVKGKAGQFYLKAGEKYLALAAPASSGTKDNITELVTVTDGDFDAAKVIPFTIDGGVVKAAAAVTNGDNVVAVDDDLELVATKVPTVGMANAGTALKFGQYLADKEVAFAGQTRTALANYEEGVYYFIGAESGKLIGFADDADAATGTVTADGATGSDIADIDQYLWKIEKTVKSDGTITYSFKNKEFNTYAKVGNSSDLVANQAYNSGFSLSVGGNALKADFTVGTGMTAQVAFGIYPAANIVATVDALNKLQNGSFSLTFKGGKDGKLEVAGTDAFAGKLVAQDLEAGATGYQIKSGDKFLVLDITKTPANSADAKGTFVLVSDEELTGANAANYYSYFQILTSAGKATMAEVAELKVAAANNMANAKYAYVPYTKTTAVLSSLTDAQYAALAENYFNVSLSSSSMVEVKDLLGHFMSFTFVSDEDEAAKDIVYKKNGILATAQYAGDVAPKADYIDRSIALANAPEVQWAVVDVDPATNAVTLQNRESGEKLEGVSFFKTDEENVWQFVVANNTIDNDIVRVKHFDNADITMFDGYRTATPNELRNQKFYIGQYHYETANATGYWAENHQGKGTHQLGVIADKDEAGEWVLSLDQKTNAQGVEQNEVDTVFVETVFYTVDANGNKVTDAKKQQKSVLAILPYQFQNKANLEYVKYADGTNLNYYVCHDEADVRTADRFALKAKPNGFSIVTLPARVDNKKAPKADFINQSVIKADNSKQWGALEREDAYVPVDNSIMVVEEVAAPEYRKVVKEWGDIVRIYRQEYPTEVLFEKRDAKSVVDQDTLSFLNVNNSITGANPAIFVDTAYVNRVDADGVANTCYQYLLAVNVDKENSVYCPYNPEHNTEAWREENGGPCADAKENPAAVKGRFLINLIDTAYAYKQEHLHNNPYINMVEADENLAKLSFVEGIHTQDTLYITRKGGEVVKLAMDSPAFNVAKFAFRYVDNEAGSFKIQTQTKNYNAANLDAFNKSARNEGYLRWVNGTIVVTNSFTNGETFNMEEGYAGTPTANENAPEVAGISVIAGNGNVIIKGAAGKKVAISNVLGQTIANTVVSSDEATIAAPAGVVVVAVEGEAAVKAIVK